MVKVLVEKEEAWMLRHDGKAFPVTIHVYGDEERLRTGDLDASSLEETLYEAVWLSNHTVNSSTRDICNKFIAAYLDYNLLSDASSRVMDGILAIKSGEIPLAGSSQEVLDYLRDNSAVLTSVRMDNPTEEKVTSLAGGVIRALNQEFIRVREGGLYDSYGSKDIYFRIGSVGVDWTDVISNFFLSRAKPGYLITVCRDEETTGSDGYLTCNGKQIKSLTFDEFLDLPSTLVLESVHSKMNLSRSVKLWLSEMKFENSSYSGHVLKDLNIK